MLLAIRLIERTHMPRSTQNQSSSSSTDAAGIAARQRGDELAEAVSGNRIESAAFVTGDLNTEREQLIREAAYFRAEQRGFVPGHEIDDWLAAERELNEARGESSIG
jgi:hypothetical protein